MEVERKVGRLRRLLDELPSALVAFSGGVDSTLLLRVAHDVLGSRCVALTTTSATMPAADLAAARAFAAELGTEHLVIATDELAIAGYAANPTNRCYFCKDNLFSICTTEATRRGLAVVLDGANVDDLDDHRPGLGAAAERGVRHLLVEAGLTKADVRAASRALGLPTWDSPASPCLSSRFPYGTRITEERLARIAAAEAVLHRHGFRELRVRYHGDVARIEVPPPEMAALLAPDVRAAVVTEFQKLGFPYVALDLRGFRSGSLNETLAPETRRAGGSDPPAPRLR